MFGAHAVELALGLLGSRCHAMLFRHCVRELRAQLGHGVAMPGLQIGERALVLGAHAVPLSSVLLGVRGQKALFRQTALLAQRLRQLRTQFAQRVAVARLQIREGALMLGGHPVSLALILLGTCGETVLFSQCL